MVWRALLRAALVLPGLLVVIASLVLLAMSTERAFMVSATLSTSSSNDGRSTLVYLCESIHSKVNHNNNGLVNRGAGGGPRGASAGGALGVGTWGVGT